MKLIIDISDEKYNKIKEWEDNITDYQTTLTLYRAVRDGKPYEKKRQGEWINHRNDFGHNIADCSECGKTMQWHDEDEDGIPRYCWFCGAKMKGPYKKGDIENEDIEARAKWICCPMCDRKTCNRRADDCDVKIWLEKHKEAKQ